METKSAYIKRQRHDSMEYLLSLANAARIPSEIARAMTRPELSGALHDAFGARHAAIEAARLAKLSRANL